jgi:hypothetical protein
MAHLIKREHDFDTYQDSCLKGARGFSPPFRFWWIVEWHNQVVQRTKLPCTSIHRISINLLEYAAIIIGLAGLIVTWEMLPLASRPSHPMVLLWTANTTTKSWTKKISGLKTPQGRTLARIFSHLLMFSDIGIEAGYTSTKNCNAVPQHPILSIRHCMIGLSWAFTPVSDFQSGPKTTTFAPDCR